ncbi:MAG: tetratricopeptide repeat protein, partial [Acidobacteria bacterium]|nr:tetratricopeptide repeat protein [Acidobacteriota bacterium]
VFDGTLKQALAVQLEQSPFLNIFSDQRVREALRFMNRSPDDRVTKDVARQICERQGLKAYLSGSISNLGSHYVITLEAVNGHTGDMLTRHQVEAESKEQVLSALGQAATKLREKLGESLASIQKYDAPIEQATTSSPEALKAFSLGNEQQDRGKVLEAIPFYKHAIELDPNFALAYARLSTAYNNSRRRELAIEYAQKAFELRERVSERERLFISSYYYNYATREVNKAIESLELWKRTYPRDSVPRNNLAGLYRAIGQLEKAIAEAREVIRLNPNSASAYSTLGQVFLDSNRFEEAKEIYERALAQGLDARVYHARLYEIAFVQGDTAAMQQQIDWASGKPEEYEAFFWQAGTAAFVGQLRKAREFTSRSVDLAMRRNVKEGAAGFESAHAIREALVGNCRQAKESSAKALAIARTDVSLVHMAAALAFCGEVSQPQALTDELAERNPPNTTFNMNWLQLIRAVIEMNRGKPAHAIQFSQRASNQSPTSLPDSASVAHAIQFPQGAGNWSIYFRGQAYLRRRAGAEAMVEFQNILDHRGTDDLLYPLAHLGLARAAALTGDTAKARKAYQDFFALWKDADADIPILIEGKKEYEKLK